MKSILSSFFFFPFPVFIIFSHCYFCDYVFYLINIIDNTSEDSLKPILKEHVSQLIIATFRVLIDCWLINVQWEIFRVFLENEN